MHRARTLLQAAFYNYPVDDLYSLIFYRKEDVGYEFVKGVGHTVSVLDEDTNMASCRMDASRLENGIGDVFGHCFDMAKRFAEDVFVIDGRGEPRVDFDHLLKWREITKLTGEELMRIAYVAEHDATVRTNFCWEDVMEVNCPWLEESLSDGVCDIHSHLNASYDAFLINWIGLMNQIKGKGEFFDRLEHPMDNPVVLRDYHFSDLYTWCILAAKIRYCLYEYFVVGGKNEKWFLNEIKEYSKLRNLNYYTTLVEQTENSLIAARNLSKVKYRRDDILDYAIDLNMDPTLLDIPFAVLSGERRIEYEFLKAYFKDGFCHSKIIQLAYLYERIKIEVRKELVQTNRKTGLVNFKLYNHSKDSFSRQYKGLKDVMRVYGIQSSLERANHFLEGRICQFDALNFLRLKYQQGILSGRPTGKYADRLRYVVHLTRNSKLESNRLEGGRRNIWMKVINDFLYLRDVCNLFVGIDFAGSELYTRPETAASTIRYARAHGINHITYHVGEDYYDLADGVRAIDECVRFCEMDHHCRLGHAMAMGVNARDFYRQNDYEIVLPLQYHLDNMVWMLKRSEEWDLHMDKSLKDRLLSESENVYGVIGYAGRFNLDNYYASMMLRGDDYLGNTANTSAAQKLFGIYLTNNRIIDKGIEPIKVKISKEYIKQIIRLQKKVCRMVADKGICMESNLTSNVLISNVKRYDAHPIGKFRKVKGNAGNELKVTLGTDDKGVFATSLYNEYALLATSMMKKKRKQGYDSWHDQHVADYIKHLADNSMRYKF